MELLLAELCERTMVESDGRFSIIKIVREFVSPAFPAVMGPPFSTPLTFVASFRYTTAEAGLSMPFRLVIVNPDGEEIGDAEMTIGVPPMPQSGRPGVVNFSAVIQPIKVEIPGDYEFHVFVGGAHVRSVPILFHKP
jgi:uncharacterized protein DUF6941